MLNFCPMVTIKADGKIPARLEKINPEFRQYARGHIEQVETLAELCARLGVIDNGAHCADWADDSAAQIVVSVREAKNVYCGGKAVYSVLIAKHEMHRLMEHWQTRTVYISDWDGKGTLKLAYPA